MTAAAAPAQAPAADGAADSYAALRPLLRGLDLRLADAVAAIEAARRPLALGSDDVDAFHPAELDAEIARAPGAPRFAIDRTHALTGLAAGRFAQLATAFGLGAFETDAVLVAFAPAADRRYERLYRFLSPAGDGAATLDLLLDLLCDTPEERFARHAELRAGALARFGLLAVAGDGEQALARTVVPDAALADFLLGVPAPDRPSVTMIAQPAQDGDGLDAQAAARLAAAVVAARKQGVPLACRLTGASPATLRAGAEALAAQLARPLLLLDLDRLAPADPLVAIPAALRRATLAGAVACVAGEGAAFPTPVRTLLAATPFRAVCPIVVAAGGDWRLDDDRAPPFATVALPEAAYPLRLKAWRHAAKDAHLKLAEHDLALLAARFRLSGRDAQRACRLAAADTGGSAFERVLAAAKAGRGAALEELARRVTGGQGWDDLVLPDAQTRQLHEIADQVANRHMVESEWGFADKLTLGRGICALFAGPSGTGKTMAAGVVARALALDLYRVDLSRTVSKFIGETEKNLDRIFDAARQADAVLFFDEADTLFGKRTEIKDAHDRYANLEVGYLLQKMEEYDGLAILATNLRQHIDEAFIRRLRAIVEFPFPGEADRARIWRTIFPPKAPLGPDIDFAALARDVRLAGGAIRNIALHGAFLAAAAGSPIGQAHLIDAARAEYRKVGRAWNGADP